MASQIQDQASGLSDIYSHDGHKIRCVVNADQVSLPVDLAIPCALVLNEILSNAYKHAFKGRAQGTIEISAIKKNDRIKITVRDDGAGMPDNVDFNRASSLGLKLIRTVVQYQLKGTILIKSRKGTEVVLEFPVSTKEL